MSHQPLRDPLPAGHKGTDGLPPKSQPPSPCPDPADWGKFPGDLNDTAARSAADGTNWCLTCDTTILPRADARLCGECTRTRSNYRRARNRQELRIRPRTATAARKSHIAPLAFDVAAFTAEYRNFDAAVAGLADATEGIGEYDVQYAAEAVTSFYYNIHERLMTILAEHDIDDV